MGFSLPGYRIEGYEAFNSLTGTQIRDLPIKDLLDASRVAFGARFNHVFTEMRDESEEGTSACARPWKNTSLADYGARRTHIRVGSLLWIVPDPLPGSDASREATGGSTSTRGYMRFDSRGKSARVVAACRAVTLDGAGGLATAGAWSSVLNSHAAGAYSWQSGELLYPTGVVPGDTIEIKILWSQLDTSTDTGYLSGIILMEPSLNTLTP